MIMLFFPWNFTKETYKTFLYCRFSLFLKDPFDNFRVLRVHQNSHLKQTKLDTLEYSRENQVINFFSVHSGSALPSYFGTGHVSNPPLGQT